MNEEKSLKVEQKIDKNSQVPEFKENNFDLGMLLNELKDVCPILYSIERFFEKWSPESYPGYHLGCTFALASIISARRVQYFMGRLRSTNLYIVLVGHTGLSAKTTVMNLINELLNALDLEFLLFPDTITAQKFFSDMCFTFPEDFEKKDTQERDEIIRRIQKYQAFAGQRGWIFDEFGTLLREMTQSSHYNATFHELIKKLDDNRLTLSNATHTRGEEIVNLPFLTLIGAMTPDDLSPHAKKGNALWGDGFFSRMIFICPPDDFRIDKPFPDGEMVFPEEILRQLRSWHNRLGDPRITYSNGVEVIPAPGEIIEIPEDVKSEFYKYRNELKDKIQNSEEKDLVGNYIRYPEIAMRIAVLIACINNVDKVTLDYWALAQKTAELWREDLKRLYFQSINNEKSNRMLAKKDPIEIVYEVITKKRTLTARQIQQTTRYKNESVAALLEKLIDQGKIIKIQNGKTFVYEINTNVIGVDV